MKYPEALEPVKQRGSWRRVYVPKQGRWQKRIQGWVYGMICVISAVEYHPSDEHAWFHISVTATARDYSSQQEATDSEMALVRKLFDVEIAHEKNTVEGIARHLWLPVPE